MQTNSGILKDFSDGGAFWLREYESDTFKDDVEKLWQTMKPLYQQIHAFVRAKLRTVYPDQILEDGLIPAHLLGINYVFCIKSRGRSLAHTYLYNNLQATCGPSHGKISTP